MPLNMNTLGMGNSSGNSGNSDQKQDLIYSDTKFNEERFTSDYPIYKFDNNPLYYEYNSGANDVWRNQYMYYERSGVNLPNSSNSYNHSFYINHELYICKLNHQVDTTEEAYENYFSTGSSAGFFKFNYGSVGTNNSSLSKVSSFPSSGCMFNQTCTTDSDYYFIASASESLSVNNFVCKTNVGIYKFDGTSVTSCLSLKEEVQEFATYHSLGGTITVEIQGLVYDNNQFYVYMTSGNMYTTMYSRCVVIDPDTFTVINRYVSYPTSLGFTSWYGRSNLANRSTVILKDYIYSQVSTIELDDPFPTWSGKQNKVINKYKLNFTYPTISLTTIKTNFLQSGSISDDDCYNAEVYTKCGNNHYLIGFLRRQYGNGNNNGLKYPLQMKLVDIYYNPTNGNVEENMSLCDKNISDGYQSFSFPYFPESSCDTLWITFSLFSVDIDSVKNIIQWSYFSVGINNGYIVAFKKPDYGKFSLLNGSDSGIILTGKFNEGDVIYTDGKISSFSNSESSSELNIENKYIIEKTGEATIIISSSTSTSFPIIIITDKYGNLIKYKIKFLENGKLYGDFIEGMLINDIAISSSGSEQTIENDSFSNRIYIDMKGV